MVDLGCQVSNCEDKGECNVFGDERMGFEHAQIPT